MNKASYKEVVESDIVTEIKDRMIVDVFPKRSSSVVDNKEPLATTNQTHNRDQSSTIVLASVGMDCYELTNGEDPHRCSNTSHTSNNLSPTVFPGIARTVETPVRVGKEDVAASFLSSPPTTAPPSPSLTDMMFTAERVGNEEGAASLLSSPSTTTTTTAPPSPSLTDMMFTAFKELRLFSAARNDHPDSRAPCRPVSIRSFETMVDKVWAQDWFDMKKEERNRNQEHIHGILDPSTIISIKDDETRELITMNLALLDLEIGTAAGGNQWCPGTLVHGHVRALHLHTQVCPQSPDCYVRSEFFRVRAIKPVRFLVILFSSLLRFMHSSRHGGVCSFKLMIGRLYFLLLLLLLRTLYRSHYVSTSSTLSCFLFTKPHRYNFYERKNSIPKKLPCCILNT